MATPKTMMTMTTTTTMSKFRHLLLCTKTYQPDGSQLPSRVEEMIMTTGKGMIGASWATAPRLESAGIVLWVEGHAKSGTGKVK